MINKIHQFEEKNISRFCGETVWPIVREYGTINIWHYTKTNINSNLWRFVKGNVHLMIRDSVITNLEEKF